MTSVLFILVPSPFGRGLGLGFSGGLTLPSFLSHLCGSAKKKNMSFLCCSLTSPLTLTLSQREREFCLSPCHARRSTLHELFHFGERCHRSISRCRHRQLAVRRAAIDRVLWTFISEKTVNQSRSKRVAATDAIEDLQVFTR